MTLPETAVTECLLKLRELPVQKALHFSTGSDAFGKHLEHPLKPSHSVHSGVFSHVGSRQCRTVWLLWLAQRPHPRPLSLIGTPGTISIHCNESLDLKLSSILLLQSLLWSPGGLIGQWVPKFKSFLFFRKTNDFQEPFVRMKMQQWAPGCWQYSSEAYRDDTELYTGREPRPSLALETSLLPLCANGAILYYVVEKVSAANPLDPVQIFGYSCSLQQ